MAEVIEFERDLWTDKYTAKSITKDVSGRYVREEDYAALNENYESLLLHSQEYDELAKNYNALLEQHRRLVKVAKYRFDMLSLIDKSRGLNMPEWEEFDTLKAALAEEVE